MSNLALYHKTYLRKYDPEHIIFEDINKIHDKLIKILVNCFDDIISNAVEIGHGNDLPIIKVEFCIKNLRAIITFLKLKFEAKVLERKFFIKKAYLATNILLDIYLDNINLIPNYKKTKVTIDTLNVIYTLLTKNV